MRPLTAHDRPVPNPAARPNPGRAASRRRKTPRRKPLPIWLRPALTIAGLALSAVAVAGSGWWLWQSGTVGAFALAGRSAVAELMSGAGLAIREINVEGRQTTSAAALLAAVGAQRGDPILFFDVEAARRRVEQIGLVKSASVQRILPGTILLRIVERRPFARWQIDGRTVLIDRAGKVLAQADPQAHRELRRVVGPGAAEQTGRLFDLLTSEPLLFERVRDAVRVRGRRWDLELDNGMTVRLPEENPEAAWRQLAKAERDQQILGRAVTVIDLRLPDRMVVRLTPEAAAPPPARKPGKDT